MSRTLKAFTIVELLVVIAIIGVMATIGIASFSRIQSNARDTQRSSKITILSEALEKYYDKNGEYPSCAAMTADSSTVTTTLKGLDPDVLTTPTSTKGTNSVLCSDPTLDTFGYLDGGSQYVLKYKAEASDTLVSLDSRRHTVTAMYTLTITAATGGTVNAGGSYTSGTVQTVTATPGTYYSFSSWTGSTGCSGLVSHTITIDANKTCTANFTPTAIAAPTTPTVTPSTVGATTTWSWGAASCPGNTARYQYRYTNTSGFDSGIVATAATSVAFTTSTEGKTYTVATQAECYNTATSSGMSVAGSAGYYRPVTTIWGCTDPGANNYNPSANANDGSCTYTPRPISPAPTITASTSGDTTTWSWTFNCPNGITPVMWQYQYYITPSGYYTPLDGSASNPTSPLSFTTTDPTQHYTVKLQDWCTTDSTWSDWAEVTYPDPNLPSHNLSMGYGGSGTVTGMGNYHEGVTVTITATPSPGWYISSPWVGSPECAGASSHTLTMGTSDMFCSASFSQL